MWYTFYVCNFNINEDAMLVKAFCNRFCLPYPQYLKNLDDISSNKLFGHWCGYKHNNKKGAPVELLLFSLFCYLGRGLTSMTVKSPLPLIRMGTECFFVFSLCLAVLFFTKDGC
jgi:hypothetical protein